MMTIMIIKDNINVKGMNYVTHRLTARTLAVQSTTAAFPVNGSNLRKKLNLYEFTARDVRTSNPTQK
jgi:hypothetical protein